MFAYYIRLGLHGLGRHRRLTALMVLAIAVGIGASMTTLTVVRLLAGDPLPGRSAHIYYPQVDASPKGFSHGQPLDVLDGRSAIDLWRAHRADRQALVVDSPIKVRAADGTRPPLMKTLLATTAGFFPMFRVPFRYGSAWSANDDRGRARVAVISSQLNDRLFGGADSVGRTLRLGDSNVRIVGVLAPWRPTLKFYTVAAGRFANGQTAGYYVRPEEVFTPFFTALEINAGHFQQFTCWGQPKRPGYLRGSPCAWVRLWVELDSAAKVHDYRRFLRNYAQQQKALGRFAKTETRLLSLMQWLDFNHVVPSDVKLQSWMAFAFLAICLANTVGLLLAKFLRRSGEISVRRALGASRGAVLAQYLAEAGTIGLLGGIGGWLATLLGLWLVRRQHTPYADLAHLNLPMFVTTFVLAIAVSLLAGALPALRASRVAPALQLKTL